jgi:Tol biopolymer transport system component
VPSGAILFVSTRSLDSAAVLHASDAGGGLVELPVRDVIDARWSPDGRRIGFTRPPAVPGGFPDLYVVLAAGGEARRVVRTRQFSWSPDGRRFAFLDLLGARTSISTIGADGRGRRRLTRPLAGFEDREPAWSPDGRRVAFVRSGPCGRSVCGALYAVNADGSGLRRLARRESVIGTPSWSPDGRRIVFSVCCGGGAYVVGADGRSPRRIVRDGTFYASWSPNGRWIALVDGETHVVRPDGSGLRRLSSFGTGRASWAPDSRAVAVEERCCESDVWIVPLDGSGARRLTEGWRYGYGSYRPEWNPRGRPLAAVGGARVSPENPTDSVAGAGVLRATRPVVRLSADGTRVAAVYAEVTEQQTAVGKVEVWDARSGELTRIPDVPYWISSSPGFSSRGFALAGERVAATAISSGGGIDTWRVTTATVSVPRATDFATTQSSWPGPCCSTPLERLAGDGPLLVVDAWGPCRVSQNQPCASEPKLGGRLYRVEGARVTQIASDRGPLTLQSVDRDRILVDLENGALQLRRADGTPLFAITYGPARLLGAKLSGDDVVVLTSEGLADYDADTGDLRHQRRLAAADPRLDDVANGVAAYAAGGEIHLLRLTDGSETVVRPDGAGPVLAQLEEQGLFYSHTSGDPGYPGRIVFVPFDRLPTG